MVLLALTAVLALLLASCSPNAGTGGTGTTGTGGTGSSGTTGTPGTGSPGMGGSSGNSGSPGMGGNSGSSGSGSGMMGNAEVLAHNMEFAPKVLEVTVGTTVTFTNGDDIDHEVEIDGTNIGRMKHGETLTWKAEKAGTHDYFCPLHPQMTGTIIVK